MAVFQVVIPDALVPQLQREVDRVNASKDDGTALITPQGLLRMWLEPRVEQLRNDAQERRAAARRAAYDAAPDATKAVVDQALGTTGE